VAYDELAKADEIPQLSFVFMPVPLNSFHPNSVNVTLVERSINCGR
jgi:hypothetical protein